MLLLLAVSALHPPLAADAADGRRRCRRRAVYLAEGAKLTLIRHGQSEWNLANRFTGWVDVDLTTRGIQEAREAARALKADGTEYDLVLTSCLRRAIRTSCLLLSGTGRAWVPMVKDARLNEQHAGALTGRNKRSLAKEHGHEQVMRWRRGFAVPPPPISTKAPLQSAICRDERYRRRPCAGGASGGPSQDVVVPRGETFRGCLERVREVWSDTVEPALHDGKSVLVVSHGNALRALIKLIDGVSDEDAASTCPPTFTHARDMTCTCTCTLSVALGE
mmetsp:Transcript_33203/g.106553  ORF Transcript_33203/g.106553 Transcript_33203/m.106553 type:complete len:277 (+) Transcript_33203:134-964(+)